MEPRPFARLSVSALGLRPLINFNSCNSNDSATATPSCSSTLLHEACSRSEYCCKVKLSHFGTQTVTLALLPPSGKVPDSDPHQTASFYLDETGLSKLLSGSYFSKKTCLSVTVYCSARQNLISPCYSSGFPGKSIGKFELPVGVELANPKSGFYLHNGWVSIGKTAKVELHLSIKVEMDPRYIFQFDGQPELSPQIVQIQGNIRQPIFSCKFTRDRSFRSRASQLDGGYGSWDAPSSSSCTSGGKDREKIKERKGWLVLIYDLSGSPVAAASMVTPFVPSAGSGRVSRANPGAWLIMKAGPSGDDSWVPWGRLEAWREKGSRGGAAGLGCRFQLMPDQAGAGVNLNLSSSNYINNNYGGLALVSESVISTQKGGHFLIDMAKLKPETPASASPVESPHSSGDFQFADHCGGGGGGGGFVMSANVQGEGKTSKAPHVQLAMRHVSTIEDAAVFMALAAAVDLSMDACLPFSKKLGKNFVAAR